MNKRIHRNDATLIGRLADIAHEETVLAYNERLKHELASDVIFYDMFNQRLSELVVQACGIALRPMLRDMISRGQGVDLIKEHFGVK